MPPHTHTAPTTFQRPSTPLIHIGLWRYRLRYQWARCYYGRLVNIYQTHPATHAGLRSGYLTHGYALTGRTRRDFASSLLDGRALRQLPDAPDQALTCTAGHSHTFCQRQPAARCPRAVPPTYLPATLFPHLPTPHFWAGITHPAAFYPQDITVAFCADGSHYGRWAPTPPSRTSPSCTPTLHVCGLLRAAPHSPPWTALVAPARLAPLP